MNVTMQYMNLNIFLRFKGISSFLKAYGRVIEQSMYSNVNHQWPESLRPIARERKKNVRYKSYYWSTS